MAEGGNAADDYARGDGGGYDLVLSGGFLGFSDIDVYHARLRRAAKAGIVDMDFPVLA